MQKYQHYLAALLLLPCAVLAQEESQSVEVSGIRNPELRSYRNIVAGLDAFEEHHALAPNATELRFCLRPKRGQPPLAGGETLSVRIVGNGEPVVLPVAADATFTVPRIQSALDENADMILNRKKGLVDGMPHVRTPGLPDNVRRLGDVRLECQVLTAIGKREMGFMLRAAISTVMFSGNWCGQKKAQFWFSASQPLESAVIRENGRESEVKVQQWSFLAPVGDDSWSNDALIELSYTPAADEHTAGQ